MGKKIFPYLEGWFLAFKKEEWSQFGGFDTRYTFADCEDLDISTTYLHNGGKLILLDTEMLHLGAQTYKYSLDREAQTKINQEKFRQKWKPQT
jgi:GT2 family glycosyltransferase